MTIVVLFICREVGSHSLAQVHSHSQAGHLLISALILLNIEVVQIFISKVANHFIERKFGCMCFMKFQNAFVVSHSCIDITQSKGQCTASQRLFLYTYKSVSKTK